MADFTDYGLFLGTPSIVDPGYIQTIEVDSQEFKEFIIELVSVTSDIIDALNKKTTGMHELSEFVTGSTYFSDPALDSTTAGVPIQRQEQSITVIFGALPNTAAKSVAHGIVFPVPNTLRMVHIHCSASDLTGANYLEIPYASPVLANNISIDVDATNVVITTGSDRTAYTDCTVVLKYLKS